MSILAFEGREELVRRLDAAVIQTEVHAVTDAVKNTLVDMIGERRLVLPADLKQCCNDAYARRLLYHSEDHGYVVVAMIWGPEQGTALHDHDGVWCVEGVLEGEIDVTQYAPMEEDGERWRFEPEQTITAGVGTSGTLIPPFEYHTIANRQADATSVTVHVYGHELQKAHIFEPEGDGWYRRVVKQLGYSA